MTSDYRKQAREIVNHRAAADGNAYTADLALVDTIRRALVAAHVAGLEAGAVYLDQRVNELLKYETVRYALLRNDLKELAAAIRAAARLRGEGEVNHD